MINISVVKSEDELLQIHYLNQENLKQHLDEQTKQSEGFVSWLYPVELLKKMHRLAPSIIAKEEERVVAYALATVRESKVFHPDLERMFLNLELVRYQNKFLSDYRFYCMGQICVAKEYRGRGLVNKLYQKHSEVYGSDYDFILTEVSTSNYRSLKAHEKAGFQTIHTYTDSMDEWNVVVWNWK